MLLEEAIKHCEENATSSGSCGLDAKQLADWLRELMQLRYNRAKAQACCRINYLSKTFKTSACGRNTTVELSCPFNEFMEKIENASVHFKVGDVTATFKQEKAK